MTLLVKIVLLVCVVVAAAKPMSEDERKAMFADLIGKCKAKEGATDSDVQEAIAHLPSSTRSGQCFNACIMEGLGLMIDSKISIEGGVKLAEMSGDPAKVKNSQIVGKECESAGGGDRCESTVEIMKCVGQASAKLGIDPAKDLH